MPGGRHPWGSPVGSDAEPWVAEKDLLVNGPVATHQCHRMVTIPGEGRWRERCTDVRVQSQTCECNLRMCKDSRERFLWFDSKWGDGVSRAMRDAGAAHLSQGVRALTVIDSG